MATVFLTSVLPPDGAHVPRVGRRIRWPGDAHEFEWNGERWVPSGRSEFDGGDSWEGEPPPDEQAG